MKPPHFTLILILILITACNAPFSETQPTAENLDSPEPPTPTPISYAERGPDAPSDAVVEYPDSLSVEYVRDQLGVAGTLSNGFFEDPEVQRLLVVKKSWLRNTGQNVDDAEGIGYVDLSILSWGEGDNLRWDVVPKDRLGRIVGWLQIRDDINETGWRYTQAPTWESGFDPTTMQFRFSIPNKLDFNNSFAVIQAQGEFRVLVELDVNGEPIRMLNTKLQEMRLLEGVVHIIPTVIFTCEEVIDAFLRGDGQFREEELERKIFHRGFPGEGVDRDLCLLGKVNYINTLQGIVLKGKIAETTPVSEIMTENVLCIDPSHSIEECIALMSAKKFAIYL